MTGSDRIVVPDAPGLTFGAAPFTISVWVQLSAFGADGGYYLMGHSAGPGQPNKWILWHGNAGLSFVSTTGWISLGTANFQLGSWYHLVITRSGTALDAYVDAVFIGTGTGPLVIPDVSADLQIGTAENDRPNRPYRGLIDDIRIFDRVLSSTEILALFREGGWTN